MNTTSAASLGTSSDDGGAFGDRTEFIGDNNCNNDLGGGEPSSTCTDAETAMVSFNFFNFALFFFACWAFFDFQLALSLNGVSIAGDHPDLRELDVISGSSAMDGDRWGWEGERERNPSLICV